MPAQGRMRLSFLLVFASASLALAQEAKKVEVMAEVVVASTQGDVIDPPSLAAMKAKFAQKTKYTSFRRLALDRLVVSKAVPAEVKLFDNRKATVKLEELKEGIAKLRVHSPPVDTVYTLGREGSLYIQSGSSEQGDVWLVLSPIQGAKPRRGPSAPRGPAAPG